MSDQQFLSTDPQAGLTKSSDTASAPIPSLIPGVMPPGAMSGGPHPEATMTAVSPNAPVTLGDLKADPVASMLRIGVSLKRDVSDPKLWIGLAASYFAPKVLGAALPMVAKAAAGMKAAAGEVLTAPMAKDLATVGLGDSRVNAGLRIAGRMVDATRAAGGTPTAPVEAPVAPVAAPPETMPAPTAPAVPEAPPSTPPPSPGPPPALPKLKLSDLTADEKQALQGLVAEGRSKSEVLQKIAELRASQPAPTIAPATAPPAQSPIPAKPSLLAAEMPEFQRLLKSGKSMKEAMDLIQQQRDLVQKLGLPSATAARQSVIQRNNSGRWPE